MISIIEKSIGQCKFYKSIITTISGRWPHRRRVMPVEKCRYQKGVHRSHDYLDQILFG
jgi:hypothetical protein